MFEMFFRKLCKLLTLGFSQGSKGVGRHDCVPRYSS